MQDRTKEAAVRKVIVSEFVSLDGVMEDPSWESPFRGEEQEEFKFDELISPKRLISSSGSPASTSLSSAAPPS